MSRLDRLPASLRTALAEKRALKVIAGLTNFDAASVERISRAAGLGGADLIDVACDAELVQLAASVSGLPICVSAVDPELFPAAVAAGAAMVEIGNYDAFYPLGRIFDAAEVLSITRRTRELLPEVVLSVTVPHVLPLDQQEQLAADLVAAGADIIQTEGGTMPSLQRRQPRPDREGRPHPGRRPQHQPRRGCARAVRVGPVLCDRADGHRLWRRWRGCGLRRQQAQR